MHFLAETTNLRAALMAISLNRSYTREEQEEAWKQWNAFPSCKNQQDSQNLTALVKKRETLIEGSIEWEQERGFKGVACRVQSGFRAQPTTSSVFYIVLSSIYYMYCLIYSLLNIICMMIYVGTKIGKRRILNNTKSKSKEPSNIPAKKDL